jgi:excisionase family DNA binding protein
MLTARELARLLNVHINTIRRWDESGMLKAYRIGPRGDRRFSREDIALFLAEKHGNSQKVE